MKKAFTPDRQIGVGGLRLGRQEKAYLREVINSNRLSYGPMSQRLETWFAQEHDCRHGIFCNSGTSALHIALAALKEQYHWADGDEVIVPAVTFIATSNIVLHNRMVPVFVDVDPLTYNIDAGKIEQMITPRTRAIIPVHLFGLPAEMDALMDIAKRHKLRVIEDSCETMFASFQGRRVGSFGDIGCFSTYIAHFIVTGVGGFCTTNDDTLAVMLKSLMNHGRDSIYLSIDDDAGKSREELFQVAARRFSFIHIGHSFRATELEAAIGLGQMEKKESIIKKRRNNAKRYTAGLKGLEEYLQLPTIPPGRDHVFMMYPLVLRHEDKAGLVNHLEERNIETRDMMPLLTQPAYIRLFGKIEQNYPVAQWINRSGFYIGSHQYLKRDEIDYTINAIRQYFGVKEK